MKPALHRHVRLAVKAVWILAVLMTALSGQVSAQSAGMTFINPEAPDLSQLPEAVSLSEEDLARFVPALSELAGMGARVGKLMSGEPGAALDFPMADELPSGSEAALADHELSPDEFSEIGQSVALAVAALELDRNRTDFEAARVQVRRMRQQIPPDIYATVMAQLDGAVASAARQPRENLALVADHETALKAAIQPSNEEVAP